MGELMYRTAQDANNACLIKLREPNIFIPRVYNNPVSLYKRNMPIWIRLNGRDNYAVTTLTKDYNSEEEFESDLLAFVEQNNL